jgi:hypothetical protein
MDFFVHEPWDVTFFKKTRKISTWRRWEIFLNIQLSEIGHSWIELISKINLEMINRAGMTEITECNDTATILTSIDPPTMETAIGRVADANATAFVAEDNSIDPIIDLREIMEHIPIAATLVATIATEHPALTSTQGKNSLSASAACAQAENAADIIDNEAARFIANLFVGLGPPQASRIASAHAPCNAMDAAVNASVELGPRPDIAASFSCDPVPILDAQ